VTLTARDSAAQEHTAQTSLNVTPLSIPRRNIQPISPVLDGLCDDDAYSHSATVQLKPYNDGYQATVQMVRSDIALWVCFTGLKRGNGAAESFAGIRIDVNHSSDDFAQTTDYGFFAGENGTPFTLAGNGSGGFSKAGPGGLLARVSASEEAWNAELQIEAAVLNGWEHRIGIDLGHYWVGFQGDDYHWPYATVWNQPITWAETILGTLPQITRFAPISTTVDSGMFVLTIHGDGFTDDTMVFWNGDVLTTTLVNQTQLEATVNPVNTTTAGEAVITVQNPKGNDFRSTPKTFVVNNPIPQIAHLVPASVGANSPSFTLTVNGSNFVNGATVLWDGEERLTTFVSATQLTTVVNTGDLAEINDIELETGQTIGVTVMNPEPVERVSNTLMLPISQLSNSFIFLPLVQR
jgi:hypothetical protein